MASCLLLLWPSIPRWVFEIRFSQRKEFWIQSIFLCLLSEFTCCIKSSSVYSGQHNRKLFFVIRVTHPKAELLTMSQIPAQLVKNEQEASVLPTSRQRRPRCLHTPGFLHLRSYWEKVWCLPQNSRVGDLQQAQRPAKPGGDGCHPSEARVC